MNSELRSVSRKANAKDTNPTRARRAQAARAFDDVIALYIKMKSVPPCGSSLTRLDRTAELSAPRWSENVAIVAIDVERAISAALDKSPSLAAKLYDWFIAPEIEPGVDPPTKLTPEQGEQYRDIRQRVGRAFISRGLYPLSKYFSRDTAVLGRIERENAEGA